MSVNSEVYESIVCFGDSLVQQAEEKGFVAKLRTAYERKLDIIGRGFSGYTTRQAKILSQQIFTQSSQRRPPKLVIIWFGTNDSIEEGNSQHVPLEETRANLSIILSQLHASPVLLLTPGAVLEGVFEGHKRLATKQPYIDAIESLASTTATSANSHGHDNVHVLNMQKVFLESPIPRKELLDTDGLHIRPKGYEVVFEAVMAAIKQHWPHLDPSKLPYVFPYWRDLDLAQDESGQRKQLEPKRPRM